jgi:hypothetical protein
MQKIVCLLLLLLFVSPCFAKTSSKDPTPSFAPIEGEFYPVEGQGYPEKMTNPYSHTRTVTFSGDPIEIYTQINMVTQIRLPAPPVMVNVGEPEGFVVEVVPEFKSVFVKPTKEIKMTNMIVTTENGIYTFILKENPFKPWDIMVSVTNPYRNVRVEDSYTLVWTAYFGKRPAEFQFLPLDIRSPNSSDYIYDPVSQMGCKVDLRRIVFFPRQKQAVYWLRVSNVLPPNVIISPKSMVVDERSVWTQGLYKVAVPGRDIPMLAKGDSIDMFLITRTETVPPILKVKMSLKSAGLVQSEVSLATASANVSAGKAPEDQKLRELYQELLKKEKIETVPYPDAGVQSNADFIEPVQDVPEEIIIP